MTRRRSGSKAKGMDWRGEEVAEHVADASRRALVETAEACVDRVQAERSGSRAEVSVQEGDGLEVQWGLFPAPAGDPYYELFLEVGTAYIPADHAKWRAADAEYPLLTERIRRNMEADDG